MTTTSSLRKVRDGDGDGFVYDGTPRQQPAPIRFTARGGSLEQRLHTFANALADRGVDGVQPLLDALDGYDGSRQSRQRVYDALGHVVVSDRFPGLSDALDEAGSALGSGISKASDHPIDGDGDGWVLDGTPQKRPATPAEMAAGAKWRASRGKGGGGLRSKVTSAPSGGGSRLSTATSEYDARIDLFHKAIDQAVHSKDPALVAHVQGLINRDHTLDPHDRADLHAVLGARRDGLPDPKPVKGSNRDRRSGLSGRARDVANFVRSKQGVSYRTTPSQSGDSPTAPGESRSRTSANPLSRNKARNFAQTIRAKVADATTVDQLQAVHDRYLAGDQHAGNRKALLEHKDLTDQVNTAIEQKARELGAVPKTPDVKTPEPQKTPQKTPDVPQKTPEVPVSSAKVPEAGTGKKDLSILHQQPRRAPADPFAGHEGSPENSPAGKQLENGTRIEDLTDTTGLLGYIADNPDQFDVKAPRIEGGSADTVIVKDRDNGRLYFFKMAESDPNAGMWGDGINEVMTGQIAEKAMPGLLPQADFVGQPSDTQHTIIRADHVTQFAKDHGVDVKSTAFTNNGFKPDKAAVGEDRRMLALHIFDYLTNQSDRHDAGIAVVTDKEGKQHYIGFDQGAAFHAHDTYLTDPKIANERGIEPFPQEFATNPEGIDYTKWLGAMVNPQMGAKGTQAHSMARLLYKGNEDQLRKDAEEILKQMHAVPLDQLIADLKKRFPNLPAFEQAHLEGMARIWKSRLGRITADDIVKGMK